MQLHCPTCSKTVDANDVNLDRMVAKCRGCHAVFDFSDQLEDQKREQGQRPLKLARREVPLPEGLAVVWNDGGGFGGLGYRASAAKHRDVTIVRRWFSPLKHLPMLLFALVWNGFMVFWYTMAAGGGAPFLFFVFPIIHVAVGVGMAYGALTGLLNRTTVAVEGGKLSIRHHPLPWPGNREVPVDSLEQLYCTENVHRGKNGTTFSYDLKAALKDGTSTVLVKKIPEAEQALYIEQAVEDALDIIDVAMPGEIRKLSA